MIKMMVDHDMELARQEQTLNLAGHRTTTGWAWHG